MEARSALHDVDDLFSEAIASLPTGSDKTATPAMSGARFGSGDDRPTFSAFLPPRHRAKEVCSVEEEQNDDDDDDFLLRDVRLQQARRPTPEPRTRARASTPAASASASSASTLSSVLSTPGSDAPSTGPPTLVPRVVRVMGDMVAQAMQRRTKLLALARDMEAYGRGVFDEESVQAVREEAEHALDELDATLLRNNVRNHAFVQAVMLYASAIVRREVLRSACEQDLIRPASELQRYFVEKQTDAEVRLRAACKKM